MVQRPRSDSARQGYGATPVRTCVGCRRRALISELLRVVAVDGALVVDERRRLPGRGAWLHPGPECLSKAERRRAFPRALRVQGSLDAEGVWQHLERFAQSEDTGPSRVRVGTRKQVDPS
ncbi:nucleotide-binding protein [Prauserella flavalba]|uniref:Nucleotide-binding protein n=1 Tax=Prauserella flavalba TaxID=1477506 RepID=A0A318LKL9_9PSEU|nr:YlxR family protein [Prauserella flavalba]PXY30858.1 nucleotide-binding protein [Prauserella flavalba]